MDSLKAHTTKLALNGITSPPSLLERFTPETLSEWDTQLGVAPGTSGWLRGICELEEKCPEPSMAVIWTNLLGEEGIHSLSSLLAFVVELGRNPDDERYRRMLANAGRRSVEPPLPHELRAWADDRIEKDQSRPAAAIEMRFRFMDT